MPYITQGQRIDLSDRLRPLVERLLCASDFQMDGELNYCITTLLHELYAVRYFDMNRALGVLEAVKLEYYRRCVAPYEDTKMEQNGDVP